MTHKQIRDPQGGVHSVEDGLVDYYLGQGWSLYIDPVAAVEEVRAEVSNLKGDELDAALERAGLPKTGRADEKRAKLADEKAAHIAETTTQEEK